MKYNFRQFKSRGSGYKYNGIKVGKTYISVSNTISQQIKTKRVILKFDKENQAIMICPTEKNEAFTYAFYSKNKNGGKNNVITSSISQEMPMCRYYLVEETEEGLIFQRS